MSNSKTDKAVLELLTKVREKKAAIKTAKERPQWITNCSFKTPTGSINIQTVRDTDTLISICASLLVEYESSIKAANQLDLPYSEKKDGYNLTEWIADLKTRARMLKVEKEQKEISELDERINRLVSAEQRREMELEELKQLLGK